MQVFDASSMIYAWDNYPSLQFPGLWEWVATQIDAKQTQVPRVAFEEIEHKVSDCSKWLKARGLETIEVTNVIAQEAVRIKGLLGIVNDRYHPKGVDEVDLLIIATARAIGAELVSDERKQTALPLDAAKRKIPAVCDMNSVAVSTMSFVEYIKRSGVIFR
jgi:Domain of unknown function (DUF4411)